MALAALIAGALAMPGAAADRGHDAHAHGVGRLDVAVEGGEVEIALDLAGADVVGFEHAAASDADRNAVAQALKSLEAGGALFAFPADARCRAALAEARSELGAPGGHGAFVARYRFRCQRPERLTHVDVRLFARFPRLQELEARTITPRGQGAWELTRAAPRLNL